jgi:hypothetical protein
MNNMRTTHSLDANLLDDAEAIIIVAVEYVGTHKSEHGHDVVQNRLWSNTSKTGNQQQRLMESLGTLRC